MLLVCYNTALLRSLFFYFDFLFYEGPVGMHIFGQEVSEECMFLMYTEITFRK